MIENTISINNSVDVSDDYVTDETQNSAIEENYQCDSDNQLQENETLEQSQTSDKTEDIMTLNLYGESVDMPVSQAKIIAQKGLAFDHIKGQLAMAKNDARLKALEDIANINGQTTAQLVSDIHKQTLTNQLIQQYGSVENAPFEEINRVVKEFESSDRKWAENEQNMQKESFKSQFREFLSYNPGCTEIPYEVINAMKNGENLSVAYSRYNEYMLKNELENTKRELEVLKSEQKAKKTSTPSAMNVGAKNNNESQEFYKMFRSTW